jgi:hypothetical protein
MLPLLLAFGLLLSAGIFWFLTSRVDATTTGSVIDIEQGQSSGANYRCGLKAEFTVDGKTYVAGSLDSSPANCKLQVGDAVEVEYQSANPKVSQVHDPFFVWLAGGLTAGGVLLLLLGIALLVRNRRKRGD